MILALAAIGFVVLMVGLPLLIGAVLTSFDSHPHRPSWRAERGPRWRDWQ